MVFAVIYLYSCSIGEFDKTLNIERSVLLHNAIVPGDYKSQNCQFEIGEFTTKYWRLFINAGFQDQVGT